jgi:plasmid stability protein
MKNITLSIPEELIRKGREYASRHGTTLNALIRQLLKNAVQAEKKSKGKPILDEMMKLQSPQKTISWNRDELYER